jgi:TPR repeat protein
MSAHKMLTKLPSRIDIKIQGGMVVTSLQWVMAAIVVALLLVLAVWYFAFRESDFGETAPATSKQAVPDIAREVISEQQQEQAPDYAATLEQARNLRAEGKLADAQLLYFFAARGGYTPAAFELAELYDPLHFDASSSLMDKPDAFQAYKWYQDAAQAGDAQASMRLQELQTWAQQAADDGDLDAEQLLLQWN